MISPTAVTANSVSTCAVICSDVVLPAASDGIVQVPPANAPPPLSETYDNPAGSATATPMPLASCPPALATETVNVTSEFGAGCVVLAVSVKKDRRRPWAAS